MMGKDYETDFNTLTTPRDKAREEVGYVVSSYIPRMPEGHDQSNPSDVSEYLSSLLTNEDKNAYISPYGQASLHRI